VSSRDDLEGSGARQVRWRSGGTFLVRQNNTQLNRVTHIAKHIVGNTGWTRGVGQETNCGQLTVGYRYWSEHVKGRDHLGYSGAEGSIILKLVSQT
jgi:hypothetical protein